MLHSFKITPFPAGKLYFLLENYSNKKGTYHLEPGLSVILTCLFDSGCDYLGGHLEDYMGGDCLWVEILEIQENRIKGRTEEDSLFFKAGSLIWFEPKHIHRVRGNLAWNIKHLNVMVSPNIIHQKEKVGYFYNTLSDRPMSFGRYFYAVSEIHKPKEDIELIEVPLSTLVELDPSIVNYLEEHATDGLIRISDTVFQSLEDKMVDRRIYLCGYEVTEDWETSENDPETTSEDNRPF